PFDYHQQIRDSLSKFQLPPVDLLHEDKSEGKISREELMANADLLENTLAQFGVKAFVKKVIEGPVITLYAVRPAEGVKINQITNLADDLALAMRAKGIRMIAPIPGEAAIGIEIPNRRPSIVSFKSIVTSEKFQTYQGELVLGMGKTIGGDVFCADLTRMPHLLMAGSTGSGKSVGINTIIASILYRIPPSDVKFVMIDPKKLELSLYSKLKNHYLAICPDLDEDVVTHPQNAVLILRSVVNEMEERYEMLASLGVREIVSYNEKIKKLEESGRKPEHLHKLPYIIVIIDELADLILTASRDVEEPITRLAQMARAVGIHLIVATQRPSVDILTGLIKANFPTRIAYQVATRPDSKVILDMYGAEKLIGNGDMLFLPPGTGKPVRLQNPFISTEEVEKIIEHITKQPKFPPYELKLVREKTEPAAAKIKNLEQDDLFEKAKEIVIRHQQGSISLLQRKLKIGYARAARLIDELEEAGIVGPGQGSKAREVLVSSFSDDKL
ncbi:MAG: DNA translocase FtsK, partial [Calditrichaeota bacterium]